MTVLCLIKKTPENLIYWKI